MTEYVMVVPAPDAATLLALGDPAPHAACTLERGSDASGRERLRVSITHADPRVVADAREAWLRAFASVGARAFVV